MDKYTAILVALGIFAVIVIAILLFLRGEIGVRIKSLLGQVEVKGKTPPPPAAIPAGASTTKVEAKGNVLTQSTGVGGAVADDIKSDGQVTTLHTPGAPPPKA